MIDFDLQYVIFKDIIIYPKKGISFIINLIFILEELMSNLKFCQIYFNNHGLDYKFL